MTTNTTTPIDPTQFPVTIQEFLAAHTNRNVNVAARTLTDDAVITDQGETFAGTERVRDFLQNAGSEFTYTSELLSGQRTDDHHWTARIRLEGDFPGHVAELDYRFTLAGDHISRLEIG